MRTVLILPGIGSSGPGHWQSRWEVLHPGVQRVEQRDWDRPVAREWVAAIEAAVRAQPVPPVLVAHSLGCLAAVQWAAGSDAAVRAMLLVAMPDPAGPNFPHEARGFECLPASLGERELLLLSSRDDPYAADGFAAGWARAWRARHESVGAAGHLNAASGLGDWAEGWHRVRPWR